MTKAVEINELFYKYDNGKLALSGINLNIEVGEKVAILGHNGAGKSTLIQHINGLLLPQKGTVKVLGMDVIKKNLKEIRRKVGVLFQDPDDQLLASSVLEDIAFGPENLEFDAQKTEKVIEEVAKRLGIDDILERPPQTLSLGQKKKVALAGLLVVEPEILLLDEPFAYLDQLSQDELELLLQDMSENNKTLIMITHDLDRAWQWADKIVILKDSNLFYQGDKGIFNNDRLLKDAKLIRPRIIQLFKDADIKKLPETYDEAVEFIKYIKK